MKVRSILILCIAIVAFLLLQLPLSGYIVDDAFIHLTFARNLAEGQGFSFNPGEPTYGITAPLWTFILAALSLFFSDGPGFAKFLSILSGFLTILAFRRLAGVAGLDQRSSDVTTLIWSVNVWLVRWSASGMEAPLAVLFLILAFTAQIRRNYLAAVWLGLAILCRPETAVLAAVFFLDIWQSEGFSKALKFVAIALLITIPWQLYAYLNFGTLRSNTALVKGGLGFPVFSDFMLGLKRTIMVIVGAHAIEIMLLIFGFVFALKKRQKPSDIEFRNSALFIVWAIFPAVFYLSQGVFISSRYLLIGLPGIVLLSFLIIDGLQCRGYLGWWRQGRYVIALIAIIFQLFLFSRITLPHVQAFNPTILALSRIAEKIRTETPPNAVIAVGDVGTIGYYADRYIVDLEGLVTKQMIPYRVGKSLTELIKSGEYLQIKSINYLVDKSQDSTRLINVPTSRYKIIMVEPVPGGLVDTSDEQWYYTLYEVKPYPENMKMENNQK